ncbi:MAG: S4 domain-containing protein [Pseudohongiellaceae bacterium]|nr:S4 domain-containing protein [Pseudohongiellaceae bacterium]
MSKDHASNDNGVRIDKWLWAARFYKTRAIAKQAVETGKVSLEGNRLKPSREVALGMQLSIRQGWDEKVVIVKGLSDQRRGASEATTLYEETLESIKKRTEQQDNRRMQAILIQPTAKPDKKDRRKRSQLKYQSE